MEKSDMRGKGAAALILTAVMLVELWPLALVATGPHGIARLGVSLGWQAPAAGIVAWSLAAGVAAAYAALSMASLPFIRTHVFDLTPLKLLAIPFALVTGTFEEWFFRKWLMDLLASHASGIALQVAASGVVFGLVHAFWGLLGGNLVAAGKSMLFTTGLGLALAVVYLVGGRQLAPAAWSHIVINLIIEPWLMLAVINLRRPATTAAEHAA